MRFRAELDRPNISGNLESTRVLLILSQDVVDRARVFVGRAKKLGELTVITESYERTEFVMKVPEPALVRDGTASREEVRRPGSQPRHTFASRLGMAGVDLRTVQRPGGGRPWRWLSSMPAWLLITHTPRSTGPRPMVRLLAGPSCKILGTLRGGVAEPG